MTGKQRWVALITLLPLAIGATALLFGDNLIGRFSAGPKTLKKGAGIAGLCLESELPVSQGSAVVMLFFSVGETTIFRQCGLRLETRSLEDDPFIINLVLRDNDLNHLLEQRLHGIGTPRQDEHEVRGCKVKLETRYLERFDKQRIAAAFLHLSPSQPEAACQLLHDIQQQR